MFQVIKKCVRIDIQIFLDVSIQNTIFQGNPRKNISRGLCLN